MAASLTVVAILSFIMYSMSRKKIEIAQNEIVIYCAAGIRLPIQEIAKDYEREFKTKITLEYSSSGELEAKLQQDAQYGKSRAHLYIPADVSFSQRTIDKGLTAESLPMAQFNLVLASHPENNLEVSSIKEFLDKKIPYALCLENAGAGKKTMKILKKSNLWKTAKENRKVEFAKVTECANAIKTTDAIQAGFIWDTTAKQFGLKIHHTPELKAASSSININVVSSVKNPAEVLHIARYFSAAGKSVKHFNKFGFNPRSGDNWQSSPALSLYCGGVNKVAVDKTISEFAKREGVTIDITYAGCGTLVSSMAGIDNGSSDKSFPDAFMTCDKSYFDKVSESFKDAEDISSTEIVILVRKGNPKKIKMIQDLSQEELNVGTTNPRKSTLGYLSWKIFEEAGIKENMLENNINTSPTAHELITQFQAHNKLDAVLVYRANCIQIQDEFELIPINHKLAEAVQNIGISKRSNFPLLMSRLISEIKSARSKVRFENSGFKWTLK
jgi:ABC-type molybdate transport system substrate-binding protein